eukprot:3712765-Rhodomonas_salina.3
MLAQRHRRGTATHEHRGSEAPSLCRPASKHDRRCEHHQSTTEDVKGHGKFEMVGSSAKGCGYNGGSAGGGGWEEWEGHRLKGGADA